MNNRYALQGLLCIVIHAAVIEGVVPADQLRPRENIVVKDDQQNVRDIVPEKLPRKRNDGLDYQVKNPVIQGDQNLPVEPKRANNLDNVNPGASVDNKHNLPNSFPKTKKPKSKKQKLNQEPGPVPVGDVESFKNLIPPKNVKVDQDLNPSLRGNSDLNGGQPALLPATNIKFTNDEVPEGKGSVVKFNQEAPQIHKINKQADTKLQDTQREVRGQADNIQQQAELRKQERENARRTQENERQEQERYQRNQEHQIQRLAEETRKNKRPVETQQSANQNLKNAPNENGHNLHNVDLQNLREQEKAHNADDGDARGNQNVDQFQREKPPQQPRNPELNGGDNYHQQEDIAASHENHPKQEFNQNADQPHDQNDDGNKGVRDEGANSREDQRSPDEKQRSPDGEQRSPDEKQRSPDGEQRNPGEEQRSPDEKHKDEDAHRDSYNKEMPEAQDQKIGSNREETAQQQEQHFAEVVGQADVKWDGDDFALVFGDGVYMEQKIRRASVPTVGEPWPKPQYMKVRKNQVFYVPNTFKFNIIEKTCDIIELAVKRYEKIILKYSLPDMHDNLEFAEGSDFEPEHLKYEKPPYSNASALVSMNVRIRTPCVKYPSASMDESYTLVVKKSKMYIASNEVWGALRALETFSQMVVMGTDSRRYIKEVLVNDYARFQHRGVLIDTARHFIYKEVIYDALEAMAQNKMNVMHWHIVDDQSFPYVSKAFPDLSKKGAFHSKMVYTPEDVADVIEYARLRGIRVVPEFDTPGHTYSWGLGYPDLLTQCHSGPTPVKGYLGPLNPASNYTYEFLRTFFEEVLTVFKDQYIHLGGDEVPLSCWVSNPEILKFSEKIGAYGDTRKLMEYYETRLLKIIEAMALKRNSGIHTVVWQDVIDTVEQLPERVIVNIWRTGMPDVQRATSMGHKVIYSTCWYLDLIEYGSRWSKYYLCDPTDPSSGYIDERLVIGGEAALWAEYIDNENLMTTLWPRASATAERLWSHKDTRDVAEAGRRLVEHRCRMLGRGLSVSQISGPDYCPSRGPRKLISANRLMEEQETLENLSQTQKGKILDASHIELERIDLRIGRIHPAGIGRGDCGGWANTTSLMSQGNGWVLVVLTLIIFVAVFFQIRNNSAGHSANRILKNKTILFSFVTLLVIYVTCYTTIWLQVLDVKKSILRVENSPMGPNPDNSFTSK